MNTILMVDDESPFLLSLKDGLSAHNDQLEILMANDGQEALKILQDNDIDLLVTDLKLPIMDGFQLLAHVSSNDPYMPVIVMTAFGTPDIEEQLSHLNALHYLEKPLDFDVLAETIDSALSTEANSYIRGITLSTFLQLIHMEKKSCTLTIHSQDKTGQLFIEEGELIEATTGALNGKEAALDIMGWDNTEIEMDSICRCESRTIAEPIGFILMEAHRIKDEDNFDPDKASATHPPTSEEKTIFQEDPPLIRYLSKSPAVKEFAIFNDGNLPEYLSSDLCSVAKLDPAYYLSACTPVANIIGNSNLTYLLFTTADNMRYMIFNWLNRRAILALTSTGNPDQLYNELKVIIDKETTINYRRGPNATTH